ncbi:gamma-tubulin complex component 4-like [Babylonia areolata]|uniref:gamma-tubulin complex component 4-like n=1 Tax=Babylonia areolata TaxID=304850 RepID=UPI003FD5777D
MLHELLLALTGHCGGVFRETGNGIQVVPDLPFIHPSEVKVLNDLCRLGTLYKSFQQFIQDYGSGVSTIHTGTEGELHGLYIRSFCRGLNMIMADYRDALLSLEQQILRDQHLPVSHLQYSLQEFQLLFPALSTVLQQIISHRAHGCYLLDILHKNSICGLPKVKDALERILHVCHGVLYKQLCAWMIHGLSHDPHHEFFIQAVAGGGHRKDDIISKTSQEDEGELGIMGMTGRQMQAMRNLTLSDTDTSQDAGMFVIQADLLPGYIPMRVASKILFVGESVQMFETNQQNAKQQSGQFMKEREAEFTKDIQKLAQDPTFSGSAFEALVDKIRLHVAEHLWVMVVQEAHLKGELRVMKDFFLLGRGELYLAFIDQAQHLLNGPPAPSTEHDVNTAYQQAARNVLIENEALLQRFKLTVTPSTTTPSAPATKPTDRGTESGGSGAPVETGWSCLGLTCTVQWPLHIFFTPSILKKYNRVFRFLLAVRRTQQDLQSTWSLQMQGKVKDIHPATQGEGTLSVWQLRHHMSFLVDNLQYYLQVDVIESQYGLLLETINTTRDFEAVKLAHEHFLAALLSQSFVHMKSVSHCLSEILDLCSSFCRLLTIQLSPLADKELTQLSAITKNFQRQSNILFRILSSVSSHNASPHLTQLLLRLDFNKYYTTSGGQLGSV